MHAAGADVFQMQVRQQYGSLVDGLRALNPKKRKPWAQWIVFMGCLYVLVSLGADRQVRDALFAPKLPGRTPTSQQVVAQAQPRVFQQRPAAAPVQVQAAPVQVGQAPVAPVAAPVAMVDGQPTGLGLFATPGAPVQQIDPGAETAKHTTKAQRGPATKRERTRKTK